MEGERHRFWRVRRMIKNGFSTRKSRFLLIDVSVDGWRHGKKRCLPNSKASLLLLSL
jgi:hypothetical protein